jgi:hypothetical protein
MENKIMQFMKLIQFIGRLLIKRKCQYWLWGYTKHRVLHSRTQHVAGKNVDVMLVMVDHFEPSRKEGKVGVQKVRDWCEKYEGLAREHSDSDGVCPQHTWFYRYDYPNYNCIKILGEYVYRGLGEIEFHLHHGYSTAESFRKIIGDGLKLFNKGGAMISTERKPKRGFAYIAGNWALDNGRKNAKYSGVNTELSILAEAGCYGDFTFPALGTSAQPRKVNSIYYAKDTPNPKSYNIGIDVAVGGRPWGDLMIFQGPIFVDWRGKYVESAAIEAFTKYHRRRISAWRQADIHVKGRPEWLFIKLHTHGMQSRDSFLSDEFHRVHEDIERSFKTNLCRLHYVTAREAYNIVKAAEAGEVGNPNEYRDYVIKPPINRRMFCTHGVKVECFSSEGIHLYLDDGTGNSEIRLRNFAVEKVEGKKLREIELNFEDHIVKGIRIEGLGKGIITFSERDNDRREVRLPYCFSA